MAIAVWLMVDLLYTHRTNMNGMSERTSTNEQLVGGRMLVLTVGGTQPNVLCSRSVSFHKKAYSVRFHLLCLDPPWWRQANRKSVHNFFGTKSHFLFFWVKIYVSQWCQIHEITHFSGRIRHTFPENRWTSKSAWQRGWLVEVCLHFVDRRSSFLLIGWRSWSCGISERWLISWQKLTWMFPRNTSRQLAKTCMEFLISFVCVCARNTAVNVQTVPFIRVLDRGGVYYVVC